MYVVSTASASQWLDKSSNHCEALFLWGEFTIEVQHKVKK